MNFQPTQETEAKPEQMESRVRPRKRRGRGFRRILFLVVLLVIGMIAYDVMAMLKFLDKANHNQFSKTGNAVEVSAWDGNERVNVLLLGVDNRDKDTSPRSDTMMLLSIDPKQNKATLMSIMRDTYVTIPGQGKSKINAAFAVGGPNLTVKTVENFLQVKIHYYMVTDFKGFEGIVNAIGGIDMNVEIPMDYRDDGVYDIHLKPGMQHLNGKEALEYVRYRGDPTADFARTGRQRKFLKAVFDQMKTPLTMVRLPSMLKEAEPYVQTNMTPTDIMRLSTDLLSLNSSSLNNVQVPPDDLLNITTNYIGESVLEPDVKGVQKFVRDTLQESNNTPSSSKPVVSPGTGSGANGTGAANSSGVGSKQGSGSKTGTGSASNNLTATVTSDQGVNVRQGPGTDQTIIGSAAPGTEVTVLAQQGDWYKVKLPDGTVGFIFGQLLTVNP